MKPDPRELTSGESRHTGRQITRTLRDELLTLPKTSPSAGRPHHRKADERIVPVTLSQSLLMWLQTSLGGTYSCLGFSFHSL